MATLRDAYRHFTDAFNADGVTFPSNQWGVLDDTGIPVNPWESGVPAIYMEPAPAGSTFEHAGLQPYHTTGYEHRANFLHLFDCSAPDADATISPRDTAIARADSIRLWAQTQTANFLALGFCVEVQNAFYESRPDEATAAVRVVLLFRIGAD